MSLKLALLLAGVIIVISVAIGAMDRARVRHRRIRRTSDQQLPPTVIDAVDEDEPEESLAVTLDSLDDAEPSPPVALEKRKLQADRPGAQAEQHKSDRAFLDELENYEQLAGQRLDVDPDIDRRVAGEAPEQPALSRQPSVANEIIDFVISLPGTTPISRNRALGLFKQNEYLLEKPRHIYGLRHVTKVWSNLATDPAGTEYDDLSLAVQMVDDAGAIDESELNTFVQMGLTFGDQFKRRTLFSVDFEDALAQAQDLNEFRKQHDVIAGVNVVANSPVGFPGRGIEAVLADVGLQFGDMNIFHRYDQRGQLAFSLANLYQPGNFDPDDMDAFHTKGVTLFMQVPRVTDCVNAFGDMIGVAMRLADRLGGRLVDQDMKSLTESGINTIRAQIELIASDMRTRGIPSGSEAARRLFSV
jgi:cell division protein ZipA